MKNPPWLTALHYSVVVLHLGLIIGVAWLVARSATAGGLFLAVLAVAPLLFPAWGITRGVARTAAWGSMIVAFYCPWLLSEAYMHPSQKVWLVCLGITAALDFSGLMLLAKGISRQAKLMAA